MAIVAPQGQPNQDEENQQQTGQPQQLAGSTQSGAQPAGGRLASFSSGATPGSQGSGRFTNLSKYMDANKTASDNLGSRANNTINKSFNQDQQKVSEANKTIADTYGAGRKVINEQGTKYKGQLGQIGTDLGTFKTFDNRGQFDQAGTQAQALAQDNTYRDLAAGTMIDQATLQNQQAQAQEQAQGLVKTAQTNLGNIQTDQGRNSLFNQVLAPKQGYSAGARSFDKLFLGGALGGIQNNLQGKIGTASELAKNTNAFGANVNQLALDEDTLLKDLSGQALANQNLFNQKLNTPENIKYVTDMRNKRFDDFMARLGSGQISKEDADLLGVSKLETYINSNQPVQQTGGASQKTTVQPNLVGTYNTLRDGGRDYFSRGKDAQSFQDIATEQDFNASQALAALSGRSGQLDGASQLNSSIIAAQGKSMDSLAKDIAAQNKAFTDQYAGKDITQSGSYIVSGGSKGRGSLAESNVNLDKYLQNPNNLNNLVNSRAWEYDYGDSKNSRNRQSGTTIADFERAARTNSTANLQAELDRIANTTGVKNSLNIDNTITQDPLTQRFKGLL